MTMAVRKRGRNRSAQSPSHRHSRSHQLRQKTLAPFDINLKRCPYPTPQMGAYGSDFSPSNTPNGIQGSARPEVKR